MMWFYFYFAVGVIYTLVKHSSPRFWYERDATISDVWVKLEEEGDPLPY